MALRSAGHAPKLRISDFVPRGGWYHVARRALPTGRQVGRHTHDFPEVFWVEQGSGEHQINGRVVALNIGDVVLMRAADGHGLRAGGGGMTLVNLAFPAHVLEAARQRYFPERDWPWAGAELPATHRLEEANLRRLSARAERLSAGAGQQRRLSLDRFLLDLLDDLTAVRDQPHGITGLPPWLGRALEQMRGDARLLHEGVVALARLAGRSREHVSRVIRKASGLSATELINQMRLDGAASDLRMSGKPLLEVASDCGLPNLGHFYRLFKQRFAVTPRQYRLRHRAILGIEE